MSRTDKPGAGGLVYSTGAGRMCPACRRPVAGCVCAAAPARRHGGAVRVSRETGGRGGKTVTIIRGVDLDEVALAALGRRLRTLCGTGGTVKAGVIELQGDQRDRVMSLLQEEGIAASRAGG